MSHRIRRCWTSVFLCLAFAGVAGSPADPAAESQPDNVKWTSQAWAHLTLGNTAEAVACARKVTGAFHTQARAMQARLSAQINQEQAQSPPVGTVSAAEEKAIHERGLLNDTATCFFITAEALMRDKPPTPVSRKQATMAYAQAAYLSHARCWDPQGGFFWSPAEGALRALGDLRTGVVIFEALLPDGSPAPAARVVLSGGTLASATGMEGAAPLPVAAGMPANCRVACKLADGRQFQGSIEGVEARAGQLTRVQVKLTPIRGQGR